MDDPLESASPSSEDLMEIIRAQAEIAKLGLDLGGVMEYVAERVQKLTHAEASVVELAEGDEMVYRAATGIAKAQLGMRLKRSGSLTGLCVEKGKLLKCIDSETDPRVDREACRRVGLRSMFVAPLRHGDNAVGAIKIISSKPNGFVDKDARILELMSELIAASMYFAARYEKDELYRRATHDAMTGIANRALFYDRLRQRLAMANRQATHVGVINLDMDGLKPINDNYGHRAGDAAIKETATRISRASRESDTVARLGGDEFGVILSDVTDRTSAERHTERIVEEIRQPFQFEDREIGLNASAGLALFPDDGADIEALMEQADVAMYKIKRASKDMPSAPPPPKKPR
jgi:diguanylate cyclase (GGDEF)-like protein